MSQYDWDGHRNASNSSDEEPTEGVYIKCQTSKHFQKLLERTMEENKKNFFLNLAFTGVKLCEIFDVE